MRVISGPCSPPRSRARTSATAWTASRWTATRTGRRRPTDATAFPDADAADGPEPERAVAELLDALAGRLGPAHLVRIEAVASHVPESAFRRVPVLGPTAANATAAARRNGPRVVVGPSDRPSLLLPAPEAVETPSTAGGGVATTDAGTEVAVPSAFRWRGTTLDVVHAVGVERIAPPWWEAEAGPFPAGERAYVVATTRSGRRLWMFLETASRRWFVHGEWA